MDETSSGEQLTPQVPAGTIAYAVGDVHGRRDLLEQMVGIIRADWEGRADISDARRCVVVYVGDYVDRGPDSKGVIDLLLSNPLGDAESIFLRGNHEDLMLKVLADPESREAAELWDLNGGGATVDSYGAESFASLGKSVPEAHLDFLKGLELHHTEGSYLFVHAGIRPGVPLERQEPRDLTWIREPFLEHEGSHGLFVVHGHTPVDEPEVLANRVCIDTRAFASGVLTALVLEGSERRFLRTHGGGKPRLRFSL